MCTGPYKLDSWKTGEGSRSSRTTTTGTRPGARSREDRPSRATPDEAALTSAFLTGELDGYYPLQLTTLDQLKHVAPR